ncbi:MAG: IS630 family transposase [Atopobiaceae bacterium]|nr:IS630 family transposase [Atopobiaceae bacterium]
MANRAKTVPIADGDRERLERLSMSATATAREHVRAKILVYKSLGWTDAAVADKMDVGTSTVRRCVERYESGGLDAALEDAPGRGRRQEISESDRLWAVSLACARPKDVGRSAEFWYPASFAAYVREVAEAQGHPRMSRVSETTLRKIMDEAKVRPFAVTYYCERRDPEFEAKKHDVLVVYKQLELCFDGGGELVAEPTDAEGRTVHTLSYDEKPGIQAIATTGGDRPPVPGGDARGRPSTHQRDHEYVRLGTLSLLAAIDLVTGVAIPQVSDTHKSSDFVAFLRKLDEAYPEGDVIRLILDNHSAHVSRETQEYLNTVPGRFAFVFTPTHGSWLNLVEAFFGKLARQMLKGIRVESKEELRERILLYFDEVNEVPVPYRWTWGLDDIDLGAEDVDSIPFEVVNAKACRPEDREKKAPRPRRRGRRTEATS